MINEVSRLVHVQAHEMGHHLWQTAVSPEAQEVWRSFISRNYTDLDLNDVLKQMKSGETIDELEKRVEKTMPLLHLQLQTLIHTNMYADYDLWNFTAIKRFLDDGGNPHFRVPAIPITGYAAKNPEEAFCETLGLLVGYGPRTVDPRIARLLQSLMGGRVRLESIRRLTREIRECDTPNRWNV